MTFNEFYNNLTMKTYFMCLPGVTEIEIKDIIFHKYLSFIIYYDILVFTHCTFTIIVKSITVTFLLTICY